MNIAMKWIDEVRGSDSIREVARRSGINQATLNRQINLDQLAFESVREIARAYSRPVLADLLRTGHLSSTDVGVSTIENALHAATDAELVLEVASRLDASEIGLIFDKPVSEAVAEATVHEFPAHKVRGPRQDDRMVANDSIEEFPETNDTDFDNA